MRVELIRVELIRIELIWISFELIWNCDMCENLLEKQYFLRTLYMSVEYIEFNSSFISMTITSVYHLPRRMRLLCPSIDALQYT